MPKEPSINGMAHFSDFMNPLPPLVVFKRERRKSCTSSDWFCLLRLLFLSLSQIYLYQHLHTHEHPLAQKFKSKRIPKRISKRIPKKIPKIIPEEFPK